MRVLTWNLHNGSASSLWPVLCSSLSVDIAFLQEAHRPEISERVLWEAVPLDIPLKKPWGSAVVVNRGALRRVVLKDYEGWVVGGEWVGSIDGTSRRVFAFSIHSPTSTNSWPRRQYVEEVDTICNAIRAILPEDADLILAGDFNFLSLGMRLEGEMPKTTLAESRVLANIESLGVKSCWRTLHPNEPLRQTLRWNGDVTKSYHCDGIFAPSKWIENSICEVLTAPWLKSDHNPVAAWLVPSL